MTPLMWQQLQVGLRLAQAGTVELSVETAGALSPDVFFDDVQVQHTGGLIVQEQHPYAFGSPLPGLSYAVGNQRYRHGYQGQFAEQDAETGFESFELRMYNSRIGRWTAPDPYGQFYSPYVGMGNNPVLGTDPDGGWLQGPVEEVAKTTVQLAEVVVTGYAPRAVMAPLLISSISSFMATSPPSQLPVYLTPEQMKWERWRTQGDGIEPLYWEHNFMPLPPVARFIKPGLSLAATIAEHAALDAAEHVAVNAAERIAFKGGGKALVSTGVQWNKHSLQRLAERGITPKMAETAMIKGHKFYDPLNKSINYVLPNGFASGKSLLVGTNPLTGQVTTVLKSSKNLINRRFIPIK